MFWKNIFLFKNPFLFIHLVSLTSGELFYRENSQSAKEINIYLWADTLSMTRVIYLLSMSYTNHIGTYIYVYTCIRHCLLPCHIHTPYYSDMLEYRLISQYSVSSYLEWASQREGIDRLCITGFRSPEAPVQSMYTIYSLHQGSIATYLGCSIYMSIVRRR